MASPRSSTFDDWPIRPRTRRTEMPACAPGRRLPDRSRSRLQAPSTRPDRNRPLAHPLTTIGSTTSTPEPARRIGAFPTPAPGPSATAGPRAPASPARAGSDRPDPPGPRRRPTAGITAGRRTSRATRRPARGSGRSAFRTRPAWCPCRGRTDRKPAASRFPPTPRCGVVWPTGPAGRNRRRAPDRRRRGSPERTGPDRSGPSSNGTVRLPPIRLLNPFRVPGPHLRPAHFHLRAVPPGRVASCDLW